MKDVMPSEKAVLKPAVPVSSENKGIGDILRNLFLLFTGGVLIAIAVNGILIPQQFLSGGLVGLVLCLKHFLPEIPVAGTYLAMNIPIFIMGWKFVGKRFFCYSIVGMSILTATFEWVQIVLPIHDKILSAILAGIFMGGGSGVVLRSKGSGGGTDILSVILLNRFSIKIGSTFLAFNVVILLIAALTVSLDAALYTLIYMYVTSQVVEIVLTGLSQRKVVLIISPHWEEISRQILFKINRGVTRIPGEGGYTGKEEKILYTVVTMREVPRVKEMIRNIDPNAFVVIYNTMEVMGWRIGNQPHW